LHRKVIVVRSEIQIKHLNTLFGKTAQYFIIKMSDTKTVTTGLQITAFRTVCPQLMYRTYVRVYNCRDTT